MEKDFERLQQGKFEDKQVSEFIEKAFSDVKIKPMCGVKIPRKLWPKEYIKQYQINNLWKYDLPDGWRLMYTILEDRLMILNLILEWFPHKEYERMFEY